MPDSGKPIDESLKIAKRFADSLPPPSSLFTSSIRAIKNAEGHIGDQNSKKLKDLTVSSTSFLVGVSPTLKTVFYRAAENLYREQLSALTAITPRDLLSLFAPNEVTGILAITYLFRHIKKRCDAPEFERIIKKMLTHIEIGAIVGKTVRHIGSGNGILLAGARYMAFALFSMANLKTFQEMRRKIDKNDQLFDLALETETFGCNHLQIASALIQTLGFGRTVCMGIAIDIKGEALDTFPEAVAEELLCWKIAITLTECFHRTGKAPVVSEDSELYLPEDESEKLHKECWSVLRDGTSFTWLTASKKDLPAEIMASLDITVKEEPKSGMEDLEEGEDAAG